MSLYHKHVNNNLIENWSNKYETQILAKTVTIVSSDFIKIFIKVTTHFKHMQKRCIILQRTALCLSTYKDCFLLFSSEMSSYGVMKVEVKWELLSYTSEKNKDDYNNVFIG